MDDESRQRRAWLISELHSERNQRHVHQTALEKSDGRVGALAEELHNHHGMRKSSIAQILGTSQPHITALIGRRPDYASRGLEELVPMLTPAEALRYLSDTDRRIERIICGFYEMDTLLRSGLHLDRFTSGRWVEVPHMLWKMDDGRWLGIRDVICGYGGRGPGSAFELMREIISDEFAEFAFHYSFLDFDLVGGHYERQKGPFYTIMPPAPDAEENIYVVELDQTDLPGSYEHWRLPPSTEHSDAGLTDYQEWIDVLDGANKQGDDGATLFSQLPDWLDSPRVGRIFTDYDAPGEQGFGQRAIRGKGPYQIIIEQGALQLWLPVYLPLDQTQLLSAEAYDALALAGLYPEELAQLDSREKFSRYISEWTRRGPRPRYIDLSRGGNLQLSYTPADGYTRNKSNGE